MTGLLLISTSLIALLGATLLVLARMEPQHRHIGEWGWSHICLAAGLALGVALAPADTQSLHYRAQAAVATALIIASLALQLAGAAHYAHRAWHWRRLLPVFSLLLAIILGLALVQQRLGVAAAALILAGGAWLAGAWLWRLGERGERFVAACFFASGLVHLSGPLVDPLARSVITHVFGTYVQGVLAMALILLSVRRAHRETARATEALRRQALHDELTDLPNRHAALARLAELTQPGGSGFALLSADLDRFQLVNESLGHEAGDALLQAIAARLRAALPAEALLARLGEDQFLLLQPGVDDEAGAMLAGTGLLALMKAPFKVGLRELYVHMSVGVARFPGHGRSGAALLRAADVAMHLAKQQAGAAVVDFQPGMAADAGSLLEIEQALAAAIEREEFQLDYQPKFESGSRRLTGFEALVRWQRPGRGRISPADFIPAAERTGQIVALGALILRQAAGQLRSWRQQGLAVLPVAVNVSPLQFEDPGFADGLLALVQAHGLDAACLEVEITETAAMTHVDHVLPQLARLREAGVGVAFDDFGTGQSSLTLLRRLPITTLKLDRSMVDPLPEPSAGAVVRAACVLAQALGLAIVAEGVETEVQAAAVEALGCTHLQGWLLSRPLLPDAAGALLVSAPSTHPS
jgi:diguanylate cyclase (GGDEF)-like protein